MKDSKFKSREDLMEESLNEFSEYSYDNASLNRIIKNAKVSKGSFYYHFKNKEDLYGHLLKEGIAAKWSFIDEQTGENQIEFDEMDIFDKFLYQSKMGLMFAEKYPRYNKLANMFAKEKGNEIYDVMMAIIGEEVKDGLEQLILMAYESGELDQSFTIEFHKQVISKLFEKYDDIFNDAKDLDRSFADLEAFIKFLRNGLESKK